MKRVTITNYDTGRIITHDLKDDFYQFFIQDRTEKLKFGKLARWLRLDQATEFELSREDDRKEVVDQESWIEEELDSEGNKTGGTIIHEAITHTEIHVPNDFTVTEEDITAQYEEELEKRKLEKKKQFSDETLIHVNYVIRNLTLSDKITLLQRADIRAAYEFLGKGSIVDAKALINACAVDSILTQEMINSVDVFMTKKINEFNAVIWS